MLTNDTMVAVTNRGKSIVGYVIAELHIKRRFAPNEKKQISAGELRALYAERGGAAIIRNHLLIENEELVNELIYNVQPEYFYSEQDIVELLTTGSLDQLLDAIDFGPSGVHDLIKAKAVQLKLNDVNKRQAILEKLGFNVTSAIEANEQETTAEPTTSGRRAAPITHSSETIDAETSTRRTAPKYKITSLGN